MRYHITVDDQQYEVEIVEDDRGQCIKVDGQDVPVDLKLVNAPSLYSLLMADHSYEVLVEDRPGHYAVFLASELYEVRVQDDRAMRLQRVRQLAGRGESGAIEVKAPMPGLVGAIEVQAGQTVSKGQGLVILEAMKMENELRAPRGGTVKSVLVSQGDKVAQGQVLLVLEGV